MNLADISEQLKAPFSAREVKLKPQSVDKERCKALALPYIDARAVQDRLDHVVGPGDWSDSYQVVAAGNRLAVICRLTVLGVTKEGIGEPGGTPGEEAIKSAESDALKRAAVKFGVARYLYGLPRRWLAYDGRKFTEVYPFPGQQPSGPKASQQRQAEARR